MSWRRAPRFVTVASIGEWAGGKGITDIVVQCMSLVVNPTLRFTLIRTFRFLNSKERDMTEFERKKAIALMVLALLGGFIFFCS